MIIYAKNSAGREVHVDSVPNGADCGCVCPSCGEAMLAVQGQKILHHFRHNSVESTCGYANSPETIVHHYAKKFLCDEKKVMTCDYLFVTENGAKKIIKPHEQLTFKKVQEEKQVIYNNNIYKSDLVCECEDGAIVNIEIKFSNRVKGNKFFDIKKEAKCPVLEIDVSSFGKKLKEQEDLKKLRHFLVESPDNRKWIYHPLIEEAEKKYLNERNIIREKEERERKKREEERRKRENEQEEKRKQRDLEIIKNRAEQWKRQQQIEDNEKDNLNKDANSIIKKDIDLPNNNKKRQYINKTIEKSTPTFPLNLNNSNIDSSFLSQLNDSQRAAVEYNDGPSLVIAGAGSGKTRVLTYKIAYLIQQGLKPWNILALTFTNKAAREMKERIGRLVGNDTARYLNMGTFHSVFSRILRVEGALIGYQPNFTIYDETDSRSLIKSIIKQLNLDEKQYKPATVHNRISMAKNHLITSDQYQIDHSALQRDAETRMPAVAQIYSAYQARLLQANAMDFDDLLVNTFVLFNEHEDIRRKYASRFLFVLVDEYQDTNFAQQSIVLQLVRDHQRVCVVGDDAQSIYAFRGANIDNILDFQTHLKGVKLFKLEQNYRSTQRIVEAANSLIRHNKRQIEKDVYSRNDEGDHLQYKPAYSDKEEAIIVCNDIKRIRRQEGCDYSDFAILYRTNAQSRSFEEQMRKDGIPYRIYGGLSFYQRKEIKDVIAYFRLVANPDDEEAFRRIINYPARGIGNTTIQKILDCSRGANVSVWEVVLHPDRYGLNVNKGTLAKIAAFQQMIGSFIERITTDDVATLGEDIIIQSGVRADIYSSNDPDDIARQENLQEFVSGMHDFVDIAREEDRANQVYLTDYLQDVALMSDLDSEGDEQSRVSLMTVHSAKGLEFPTVFIVGLEENIFPSQMSLNSLRELEEERRLLYVAITRAEKHCILTNAKCRFRYGRMEYDEPSRFLRDIDPRLIVEKDDNPSSSLFGGSSFGGRSSSFGGASSYGSRMQNSRPVATQFRADPKPKITSPRQAEQAVNPFSERFQQRLANAGGNLRRINSALTNGGRTMPTASSNNSSSKAPLVEGNVIEHQRFGIGTVIMVEGTGENAKATVDFKNVGTKQLLLKFAKYQIIK